jgi:broad specificity phosphatase PhoE
MAGRVIWIARHASRLDFSDPEWAQGSSRPHDPPLSPAGRLEAEALACRLARASIAHLFSSPFLRCVETAQPVAARLGLPIKIEPALSEWLNRAWFPSFPDVLPVAELARRFPEVDRGYAARGEARYGESGEEALVRSAHAARRITREFAGDLLLVGHGASVLGAASGLLGDAQRFDGGEALPELPYACLVELVDEGAGWRLVLRGDVSHLRDLPGSAGTDRMAPRRG